MKRCAVCGKREYTMLAWRRDRDGKTVNVCCECAESHKVNENSIDNYTTADTYYIRNTADTVRSTVGTRHYASSVKGGRGIASRLHHNRKETH